jgi:Holliday junction resolvase
MPHSSKRKGNRYEREVVADAEAAGLDAERAYASDGRSLGEAEECDVLIRRRDANVLDAVRVQAKRRKTIAQYLQPPEGADVVVTREDRGDSLAVVPLRLFLNLLTNQQTGE